MKRLSFIKKHSPPPGPEGFLESTWVVLSVNYRRTRQVLPSRHLGVIQPKMVVSDAEHVRAKKDGELCGSALTVYRSIPMRSSSRRIFPVSQAPCSTHLLLWKSRVAVKTPGRLGSFQATPRVKHMGGENGTRRVETRGVLSGHHTLSWYSNPLRCVCMLLLSPLVLAGGRQCPVGT